MPNTFRMFPKPGPPGEYYGYIEIDGVTYSVAAKSVKDTRNILKSRRIFVGTVKRHLKSDQQKLDLRNRRLPDIIGDVLNKTINDSIDRDTLALAGPKARKKAAAQDAAADADPELNDDIPF
jgi:hypothetical protein